MFVYLDNHATTAVDPRVLDAMLPYFTDRYGNAASRGHTAGYQAKSAVEKARTQVADALGASPKEVVFTSGATESNNLAILGAARARGSGHLITVQTEHKAVLDPCDQLQREGFRCTRLAVDASGTFPLSALEEALEDDTVLVSAMAVNNEIGTRHDLAAIGALCRERGVLFHSDAAQALHAMPLDVGALNVDLLSLSGHKAYGPKGIGVLYVRRGRPRVKLAPLFHGGGHERGLRSGTLPVPLIVGMGVAAEMAVAGLENEVPRIQAMRDRLWQGLSAIGGLSLNGAPLAQRSAHNLNLSVDGVEAEALMMALRDIAMSTGSACTSATLEPSHVLRAIGTSEEDAHRSIRFGLGRFTTEDEIAHTVQRFEEEIPRVRKLNSDFSLG